ncbi:MAG: hypothetical protein Q8J68_05870 [Methanolobus sp.]|uniref:DNA-3-methyladenine glycosylase family protein n=1 Tax=Methanolobus sp. TaxID=1874737 RepID=UPI0027301F6A|nr:hypothetical protein [Methanolobus sp.]MDP2216798.1 hypothetical protein [Methanolobus sp.]
MQIFRYGKRELDHLKKRDEALGAAIDRIGMLEFEVVPDLLASLVKSIITQQISTKAAWSIWNRMLGHFGAVTPRTIHSASAEDIQRCGLSMRKARSIKEIARAVINGELNLSELHELPDKEVIRRLSSLNGIGTGRRKCSSYSPWSAPMWSAGETLVYARE